MAQNAQHDQPLLLIVDDQPMNLAVLVNIFKADCDVCTATSAEDGLLFCQRRKPDLILMDVVMPGMDGHAACRQLQADPWTKDIPVIFVTGKSDPMDEARCFDAGCVDFISKPFHAKVVRARVRTHLMLKYQHDALRMKEYELQRRQAELEGINDSSPLGMFRTDVNGLCTYVNRAYETMSGLSDGAALGLGWRKAVHPDDVRKSMESWASASKDKVHYDATQRFLHADGKIVLVQIQAAPIVVNGVVVSYVGTVHDITARVAAEENLADSNRRLRMITDNLPVAIMYIDRDLRFRSANATLYAWIGKTADAVLGKTFGAVRGANMLEQCQQYFVRALAGERVDFELTTQIYDQTCFLHSTYIPDVGADGRVQGIYALCSDISALKKTEKELRRLARVDSLTGLPNRLHLYESLDAALVRSCRSGDKVAVLFLDIDYFKSINDLLGHANGDLVLQEFALRLKKTVRLVDTVARLGGDEFVILIEGLTMPNEANIIARKILKAMDASWLLDENSIAITTSIGIAFDQNRICTGSALIDHADAALYAAKAAGRNTFHMHIC